MRNRFAAACYLTLGLAAFTAGGLVVRAGFYEGLFLAAAGLSCCCCAVIHYEATL